MTTKHTIDKLWQELRDAINKTYREAKSNEDGAVLRDYAEDISWNDDLAALLGRESANERQHRRNRPSPKGFSIDSAAKLILMNNAVNGATADSAPSATLFLQCRRTAVEAQVIGHIIKANVTKEWREAVESLDYGQLMQA